MSRNLKAIIACAAALVIVGGGYTALMLTEESGSSSSSASEGEPIATSHGPVLSLEKTDIKSISVKNKSGGYEGVPSGKTGEDGFPIFEIKGIEDLPMNESILSSLLNNASNVGCDSVVEENAKDLDKYGLKDPQAEVTVKTADGEKVLCVGNESPESGETYCMLKGEKEVFLTASAGMSVFANAPENFLATTLIPKNDDKDAELSPGTIKIVRDDLDYDILLEKDTFKSASGNKAGTMATHYMTEPIFSYLDAEKSQNATQGFFGLSAYSAVYAHPTDEQIKGCGLDAPSCTVSVDMSDGSSYTLKIGKKLDIENGEYYALMINDVQVIYAVSADDLCWASMKLGDITSKMIFGTFVWDVGKLTITAENGTETVFEGKGTDEDSFEVTKNGEKCSKERYKEFYQFLLKASAEEVEMDEQPQGEPYVAVDLESQDGQVSQKVEFYKSGSKKCLIVINGRPCFKCRSAYAELLLKNLSVFDSDEAFVTNW